MKMRDQRGEGELSLLIGVAIVIAIGVFAWNHLLVPAYGKYVKKYDKPWWTGTSYQRVCPAFDDSEDCYTLPVTSDGDNVTQISFPNGGYVYATDSGCYQAASGYTFDRFCRFYDQENRLWDIDPN